MLMMSLSSVTVAAESHGQLVPGRMGLFIPPPEIFPILIAIGLALGLIAVLALRGLSAIGRASRRRTGRRRSF